MQVQKKSKAFWLLLFPGRVILFFQIRASTGFWFCILKWFYGWFSFSVFHDAVLLDQKNRITHHQRWKSTLGRTQQSALQWLQNKLWLTSWTRALQVFAREEISEHKRSELWIPEHCRTIFFAQMLLQRLASCRLQCLFVQIILSTCWIIYAGAGLDSASLPQREDFSLCSKRRTFLRKKKKKKS